MKARISLRRTSEDTSSTAATIPNRFTVFRTLTTGAASSSMKV